VGTTLVETGTENISKSVELKSPQPQAVEVDDTSRFVTLFNLSVVFAA
jgi:hypothetical protein